jgi:hypothetical protein
MNVNISNLDSTIEHWASIDGYLNYQVSWWGRVVNTKTGRILKNLLGSHGYLHVSLSKNGKVKTHCIHVLVAQAWVLNSEDKKCVDHIDGDKTNNHLENLRYATFSENSRNMRKHADGSSSFKGVSWDKRAGKWRTQILVNRKVKTVGRYHSEREAAEVYNAAAIEHYGEFAKLNKLD